MNPDPQELNALPLMEALERAVEMKWSGVLSADEIGSVFVSEGNIAWAVGRNQTENFSSILERQGLISKERLSEIVTRQKALGKSRRLSELLEEEGVVSREGLRECLREHIRAAIAAMISEPGARVEAKSREIAVDGNLVFQLEELLPGESWPADAGREREAAGTLSEDAGAALYDADLNGILGGLASLPGYRFSFITSTGKGILALHLSDNDPAPDDDVASANSWISAAAAHSAAGYFGKTECVIFEHEKGVLMAQTTGGEPECLVIVSFEKSGKLGVFKHKVAELIPAVRKIMA